MKQHCKVCGVIIHPKRAALGYTTTCPEHSTSAKYVGFVVAENEDVYEVNIVRDPETAKDMERLLLYRGQVS